MTKLSVNINKIATLRNSRGGNNPDIIKVAKDIVTFGADGITVHPRPDERHIRYADVFELKKMFHTEFNIEGNSKEQKFVDLVLANKPEQVTLVPDALGQLTSDHGWDTNKEQRIFDRNSRCFSKSRYSGFTFCRSRCRNGSCGKRNRNRQDRTLYRKLRNRIFKRE